MDLHLFTVAQTQDRAVFEGDKDLSVGDCQPVIDRRRVQLERGDLLAGRLFDKLDMAADGQGPGNDYMLVGDGQAVDLNIGSSPNQLLQNDA